MLSGKLNFSHLFVGIEDCIEGRGHNIFSDNKIGYRI